MKFNNKTIISSCFFYADLSKDCKFELDLPLNYDLQPEVFIVEFAIKDNSETSLEAIINDQGEYVGHRLVNIQQTIKNDILGFQTVSGGDKFMLGLDGYLLDCPNKNIYKIYFQLLKLK